MVICPLNVVFYSRLLIVFFSLNFLCNYLRLYYSISSGCGTLNAYEVLAFGATSGVDGESALMNVAFSCARVNLFTCSISFKMHTPPPSFFAMTNERWKKRGKGSFNTDACRSCSSQKIPVTVSKIRFS